MGISLREQLESARKLAGLTQEDLALRAGLSRMTVQRLEGGKLDPRFSTLQELARVLGLDIMLVPAPLRMELEGFIRSGGRLIGQAPGVGAPPSVVDVLTGGPREPGQQ